MGLSERERKIIEEMEAALQAEDPRLVATMERERPSILINAFAILAGFTLLLTGVITKLPFLGVLGFLIVLGGAATIRIRPLGAKGALKGSINKGKPGNRMQDRWNKRNQ